MMKWLFSNTKEEETEPSPIDFYMMQCWLDHERILEVYKAHTDDILFELVKNFSCQKKAELLEKWNQRRNAREEHYAMPQPILK